MTCEKKKSEKAYHSKKKVEGKRIRKKKNIAKMQHFAEVSKRKKFRL